MAKPLTFADLRAANLARCARWHPGGVEDWSLADWSAAVTGEWGEANDLVKKLNRVRDGLIGNKESEAELRANLADEIADTLIYLDLFAARAGVDLAQAVISKFNAKSAEVGFPERLGKTASLTGLSIEALWQAVDMFAEGMKAKLAAKVHQGWRGWDHPQYRKVIEDKLRDHVDRLLKGQPQHIDVANLAMFLWWQAHMAERETS